VGKKSMARQQYKRERRGWNLFYDTLSAVKDALRNDEALLN